MVRGFTNLRRVIRIATAFAWLFCATYIAGAQDSEPELQTIPAFLLPDPAVAAGIGGTMTVTLSLDKTGAVRKVQIPAGPSWPCGASPGDEIENVKAAVKANLLAARFTPMLKDGKPKVAEISLDFALGEAYQRAAKTTAANVRTIGKPITRFDAGAITRRATALVRPANPSSRGPYRQFGTVTVRATVDEKGKVVAAGIVRGHPMFHAVSRSAACKSTFEPMVADGKPIRYTGLISYIFNPRPSMPPGF